MIVEYVYRYDLNPSKIQTKSSCNYGPAYKTSFEGCLD